METSPAPSLQRQLQEQRNISDDHFKSRTNIHGQDEGTGSGSGHTAAAYTSSLSSSLPLTQETLEATGQALPMTAYNQRHPSNSNSWSQTIF
ncbi:hypothetical protein BG015_002269 [Linnemannia schmuckeri]|uniref:Uncharacterized protein n=1 Tax=Linnemannia schmuckeri TaxID=64567 RepID=A0A9P5RS63_9FUNG|nr:hypothetical protein BG015_002269 [Linnemannia schmuckeri]